MRDARRLLIIYTMINEAHKAVSPDLRIGQFIINFLGWVTTYQGRDPYYIKDEELVNMLEEYVKEVTGNDELFND